MVITITKPSSTYTQEVKCMADVIRMSQRAGNHFFDDETMRYFKSRICGELVAGQYFITSERYMDEPRAYTIRRVTEHGDILTIDNFQGKYKSLHQAKTALKYLLENEEGK